MKLKKIFLLVAILFIGGAVNNIEAQDQMEKLMEMLDKRDDVKITNVNDKVVTVSFKDNPELEKLIMETFAKEKPNAANTIEEKDKGQIVKLFYTFKINNKQVSYSYNVYSSGRKEMIALYN